MTDSPESDHSRTPRHRMRWLMVALLGMLLLGIGYCGVEFEKLFDMQEIGGQFTSDEETTASGRNTRLSFLLTTEWQEKDVRYISRYDVHDRDMKMHGWWASWYEGSMSSNEPAKGEAVYVWTDDTTPRTNTSHHPVASPPPRPCRSAEVGRGRGAGAKYRIRA